MKALGRLAASATAAILFAGGCSGESDTEREPTVTEQSIIDQLAVVDDESVPTEVEAARESFVTECMDEEGLAYLGPPEAPSMLEWLGLSEEEFRAEYGFGHSTTVDIALGYEAFTIAAMEEYQASFEILSTAERERYKGRELECLQESYAELGFPDNGTVYLPNDSPIHEYTSLASEASANDPRLAEVTAAWSDCMRDRGYDFSDRDEMGLPLQEEAQQFLTSYSAQGQAVVDAGTSWEELRAADVLDAEQLAALEDLQQRELDTAATNQYCIDQGHDIEAVYSELYDEHMAEIAGG